MEALATNRRVLKLWLLPSVLITSRDHLMLVCGNINTSIVAYAFLSREHARTQATHWCHSELSAQLQARHVHVCHYLRLPRILCLLLLRYWDQMISLLHSLMEITAVALGLPTNFFESCFAEPECVLRLGYYPAKNRFKVMSSRNLSAHLTRTGRPVEIWGTHRLHRVSCAGEYI